MAALFASAFWPRLIDTSRLPDHPLAKAYVREARDTIALARGNPVQQVFDAVLIQRWSFSDWREVPGSGEGSTSLPSLMDTRVTVTGLGPWGIPVARMTIGCGGACFQRDR